jgi:hypothetical protein
MTLKKHDLPLAGTLGDTPPASWADDFDQVVLAGNPLLSEALFFHKPSHTLIAGDVIQIQPNIKGKPIRNMIFGLGGVNTPQGGVALDIRLTFLNRKLAWQSVQQVLAWDFDKVIIAHGPCVAHGAKQFIEHAFHWLLR